MIENSISKELYENSKPLITKFLKNPFLLGLTDNSGRVPKESFDKMHAQEVYNFYSQIQAYSHAITKLKTDDQIGMEKLVRGHEGMQMAYTYTIQQIESEKMDLNSEKCKEMESTKVLNEELIRVSSEYDNIDAIFAFLLPSVKIIYEVGQHLKDIFPDCIKPENPYSGYMVELISKEMNDAVIESENALDFFHAYENKTSKEELQKIYNTAIELHFNHFSSVQLNNVSNDNSKLIVENYLNKFN